MKYVKITKLFEFYIKIFVQYAIIKSKWELKYMFSDNLRERLKIARESAGYTQRQIEAETGIGQSQIASYETGRTEPNANTLGTLAQFYNVSIDWLFGLVLNTTVTPTPTPRKVKNIGVNIGNISGGTVKVKGVKN
ncbi:hypothetical protein FACS189490_07960 [Clostridia bacterium]|nr:hypothetical protein FACS189490_07960 [Clostridia bacterium]